MNKNVFNGPTTFTGNAPLGGTVSGTVTSIAVDNPTEWTVSGAHLSRDVGWKKTIISVDEFDDRIEIVYKSEAPYSISIGFSTSTPTRVWKEIIRPDGKGFSKETIEGEYVPSQYIEEQFNF